MIGYVILTSFLLNGKDFTQMIPNQYAKSLKLNMIKEILVKRDQSHIKINQLALEHGFWHMGQFATDFRKQFGVLPSKTFRKD